MSELSPAQELRKAAERIREAAGKAAPGPWCGDYTYTAIRHVARNCDIDCGTHADGDDDCGRFDMYDGPHVAMWDPGVALLVAAWLDEEAKSWSGHSEKEQWFVAAPNGDDPETASAAWLLARAINATGGQS